MVIFLFGTIGVFAALFIGIWLSDPNTGRPSPLEIRKVKEKELVKNYRITSHNSLDPEETWMALSEKDMAGLKNENQELKNKLDELLNKVKSIENKNMEMKEDQTSFKMSAPLPENDSQIVLPPIPNPREIRGKKDLPFTTSEVSKEATDIGFGMKDSKIPQSGIEMVDLTEGEALEKKGKDIKNYLPSGTFTKAVLLSGVDAPTGGMAQQNPMPILMKLVSHGQLPNYFKGKIKDCHATGAAFGDISSERAMIRLEILSCVLEDGRIIETPIKGFVAGEDGKSGFRGKLISKQGSLIARSALAGVFSGMGQAISQQYQQISTSPLGTVQTMDPTKVAQAGLANGTSNALEKIADFYIARANETYPIIEVDANREGEIVLTGGSEFGLDIDKKDEVK